MTDLMLRGLAATGSFDGAAERTMPKRSRAEQAVAAAIFVAATVAVAAWRATTRSAPTVTWAVQMALNLAWTAVFFGLESIGGGLLVIGVLFVAIVVSALVAREVSRPAALVLVPYIAWVAFAAALNAAYAFENFA
jgi:translocator protein